MAKTLKQPKDKRQAEYIKPISQNRFLGQLDIPASSIDQSHESRLLNKEDKGLWQEGRSGSRLYSSTTVPSGTFNGRLDLEYYDLIVWVFGSRVYISPKDISTFSEVFNRSAVDPTDGDCTIREHDKEVYIFSSDYLFRVILDEEYYYMYRINGSRPRKDGVISVVGLIDVEEDEYKQNVYRYLFSGAIIAGSGNRNRIGTDLIDYETGTCAHSTEEKDYAEVATEDPIGPDTPYLLDVLEVPRECDEWTHMPLYRTKNIGRNCDPPGIDPINGLGNNSELYCFVDDVPVMKCVRVAITGDTATISDPIGPTFIGVNDFVPGDVGSNLVSTGGASGVIESYVDEHTVTLFAGHTLAGTVDCVIEVAGCGIMTGSQTGRLVTLTVGDFYEAYDHGKPIQWADGSRSWIEDIVLTNPGDATSKKALVKEYASRNSQPVCIRFQNCALQRAWNDTTPDNGQDVDLSVRGLQERIASKQDLYIPRRFFQPLPGGNCGVVDTAFTVIGDRDDTVVSYCQIGDKKYTNGHYRPDHQKLRMDVALSSIEPFSSVAVLLFKGQTHNLMLNNSINVGNQDIGENVYKLQKPELVDTNIGVIAWQTIAFKGSAMMFAVTNEPHVRVFNGLQWSERSYDIDPSGMSAIQKYLANLDPYFKIHACYSKRGGYKLWFYYWDKKDADGSDGDGDGGGGGD